jgi:hypothetical protein
MGSPDWTKKEWMKEVLGVIIDSGEAIAGSVADAAGLKRTDVGGDKERSWVRPSTSISNSPVHVGSIYFRTKDSSLGSEEEGLLEQLAKAYSAYARRDIQKAHGQRGLKGNVTGYATHAPLPSLTTRSSQAGARRLSLGGSPATWREKASHGKVFEEVQAEIRKDYPDLEKMQTYREVSQVYMYMIRATGDLAKEVIKLAES